MVRSSSNSLPLQGQGIAPASESPMEWNQHEHVAPAIELEAQQLIDHAGSPDLARQAIDAASHHFVEPHPPPDELAQQWGFESHVHLIASSTAMTARDGSPWWVTEIREQGWLVWTDQTLAAPQQFPSLDAVTRFLAENRGIAPS